MIDWEALNKEFYSNKGGNNKNTINTDKTDNSNKGLFSSNQQYYKDIDWDELDTLFSQTTYPIVEEEASEDPFHKDEGLIEKAPLPNSIKRGLVRASDIPAALGTMFNLVDPEDYAEQVSSSFRRIQQLPMTTRQKEGLEDIYEAEGFLNKTKELISNPETAMSLIGESLAYYVPAGAMGVGATLAIPDKTKWLRVLGGSLGFGTGSALSEASASLAESLAEQDIDVTNPVEVHEKLQDDEFLKEARERASKRGVTIGIFDGLTFAISSLPYKAVSASLSKAGAPIKAQVAGGLGAEAVVQAAGGAGGEKVAQLRTGEDDPTQVFLEGALEVATAGPQAVMKTVLAKNTTDGVKIKTKEDLDRAFAEEIIETTPEKIPQTKGETQAELFQDLQEQSKPEPEDIEKLPKKFHTIKLKGVQPDLLDPDFDQNVSLQKVDLSKRSSPKPDALGFYSKLEETLREKLPEKGTGPVYNDIVNAFQRKGLYAKEELDFSGLQEYLESKKQINKDEVLDFISKGGIQIEEVVYENDPNFYGSYKNVTLEGVDSNNYRETLLKLPEKENIDENFYGEHWEDHANVVAHYRTSDKIIDDKNTLFVEEVQSDWHQQGRDQGYKKSPEDLDTSGWIVEPWEAGDGVSGFFVREENGRLIEAPVAQDPQEAIEIAKTRQTSYIPEGPFKKNWHELALKRILKQASEEGYEQVAFPAGTTADALIQKIPDAYKSDKTGMNVFYDQKIPQAIKKLSKKYGIGKPKQETYEFVSPDGYQTQAEVYTVDLPIEARDTIDNLGFPLYQRLDRADSLFSKVDFFPTTDFSKIQDNLYAMRMSPELESKYSDVKKEIQSLVNNIAGRNVKLDYFDTIISKKPETPHEYVRGAQFSNTIAISLGLNEDLNLNTLETAAHETWHFIEQSGVFNNEDINLLEEWTPRLAKMYQKDTGISDLELAAMTINPRGREEFRAHAFGNYTAKRIKKEKDYLANIPKILRPAFNKAYRVLTGLKRILNRNGVNDIENLFAEAYEGRKRVSDIVNLDNSVRLQNLINDFNKNIEDKENDPLGVFNDIDTAIEKQNDYYKMSGLAKLIGSPSFLSSNNPVISKGVSILTDKIRLSNAYLSKYQKMIKDFDNAPKEFRYRAYDLLDHMRNTNQEVELDSVGRLHYFRDNKEHIITDVNTSKLIYDLHMAYQEVFKDARDGLRRTIRRAYKDLPSDFTRENLIALRDENNAEEINTFIERLDTFENREGKAYVPHSRFGEWGVVVLDRTQKDDKGKYKVAGFYQVEGGKYKGKYNKYQLERVQEELKEKFSDKKRYKIVGEDRQKITDINDLGSYRLFGVNKNAKLEDVDGDLATIDNLFSLFGSKNEELFADMREELIKNKKMRGFQKRFAQSKNIDGYSRDWDRVHSSYFHGASNYFANLDFLPKLSYYENSLKDLNWDQRYAKQWGENYIEYLKNPHEDWAKTKMFNFLWTLGWNPSTAILQTMSLYTHGLGYVTGVTGSPVKSLATVNKWLNLASLFTIEGFNIREASVDIDFGDNKAWERIRKDKKLSPEALDSFRDLVKKLDGWNILGGVLTAEHIGLQTFETRGEMGALKRGFNRLQSSAGIMISTTEQLTRMAVLGSIYDSIYNNPRAMERGRAILAEDLAYADLLNDHPDLTEEQAMATYMMERAMAVFGKQGRPEYMRGIGSAVPFAFMTYPHQMWENMFSMTKTKEGRQGLMATLGAYMVLGGLIGLPGGEFLKELYEKLYQLVEGDEIDLDLAIREKMYQITGDARVGLTLTQGFPRTVVNMDVTRRTGIPVPGQELLFLIAGIRKGEAAETLGVPGSAITGFSRALGKIREDSNFLGALGETLPTSVANFAKAAAYGQEGVRTRSGKGLLGVEDVTTWDTASRLVGFSSGDIANMREKAFYEIVLERQHKTAYERFRKRAKNYMTKYLEASRRGETKKADKAYKEYNKVLVELSDWAAEKQYPLDMRSFTSSVISSGVQRLDPKRTRLKGVSKAARKDIAELNKTLGIEED